MLLMKAVEGIPKVNLSGAAAIAAQHKKSNPDLKVRRAQLMQSPYTLLSQVTKATSVL